MCFAAWSCSTSWARLSTSCPELLRGKGIEQRNKYHVYDVFVHCIMSAVCVPPQLTLRLAALLHDVGKPEAVARGGKMLGHDILGADIAQGYIKAAQVF